MKEFEQGHSYLVSYLINGAASLCKIKVLVITDTHIQVQWLDVGTTSRKDLQEFKFQYKIVEEIFSQNAST